ncbi:MAG: hypothetical protein EOM20_07005 [Spartobacteria bacterium]|nr:hypothetical protein [Spartobacteria bacterium]
MMRILIFLLLAGFAWGQTVTDRVPEVVEAVAEAPLPESVPEVVGDAAPEVSLTDSVTEVLSLITSNRPDIHTPPVRKAVLDAVVKSIDPYGRIICAEEYEQMKTFHHGGISAVGVDVDWSGENELRIVSVYPDTFAEAVGLVTDDIILSLEDASATNLTLLEITKMLRGPIGETVHLQIRKPDGTVEEYDVGRDMISVTGVDWTEHFPEDIAYIRLSGVFEQTGQTLVDQLLAGETGEVFGAILDMRDACGKDMASVDRVGSLFADAGDLLYVLRDRDDQDIEVSKAVDDGSLSMPVMVLVNTNTCGAAEALAGVLQGSTRGALLVGTITAGDFTVREPVALSSGDYLFMATRKMVVADGTVYDGTTGVEPDILMVNVSASYGKDYEPELTEGLLSDEEKEDRWLRKRVQGDPILHRAVNLILGLKALNLRKNE